MGCHKIQDFGNEIRAALPDGDNPTSVRVIKENLITNVFTRSDFPEKSDLITLVEYIKKIYFIKAIYWICQICGYDYYSDKSKLIEEEKEHLKALEQIEPRKRINKQKQLEKKDEKALLDFIDKPNLMFIEDGINIKTQYEFEIKYSIKHRRIAIPIRDELGNLVGVKGRTIEPDYEERGIPKYNYIIPTERSQVLYGLYKTLPYIKQKKEVIVFESEKAVMQAWAMGYKNCVAVGGGITKAQAIKLERLRCDIVLALDKGLDKKDIKKQAKQIKLSNVYAIWDKNNWLNNKESPVDKGKKIWELLYYNKKYSINLNK